VVLLVRTPGAPELKLETAEAVPQPVIDEIVEETLGEAVPKKNL
jgi:hypothetical protein